jgi:dolichyl-phosphate-mannose-protein mannosyltransferase
MASPSPAGSVRHRGNAAGSSKKAKEAGANLAVPDDSRVLDELVKKSKAQGPGSEWDYKIALAIITVLAFVTRFWGISHPNEVVFDEVHFGKVSGRRNTSYPLLEAHLANA